MHSLTDHGASVSDIDEDNRVELQAKEADGAEGNVVANPTLADPVGDQEDDTQRGRGRKTLEVFCLSGSVVGDRTGGDVEASKTEKTAEGE